METSSAVAIKTETGGVMKEYRKQRVVELARKGWSFSKIAKELGWKFHASPHAIWKERATFEDIEERSKHLDAIQIASSESEILDDENEIEWRKHCMRLRTMVISYMFKKLQHGKYSQADGEKVKEIDETIDKMMDMWKGR